MNALNFSKVKIESEVRSQEDPNDNSRLNKMLSRSPLRDHITISQHRDTESEGGDGNFKLLNDFGDDSAPKTKQQKTLQKDKSTD